MRRSTRENQMTGLALSAGTGGGALQRSRTILEQARKDVAPMTDLPKKHIGTKRPRNPQLNQQHMQHHPNQENLLPRGQNMRRFLEGRKTSKPVGLSQGERSGESSEKREAAERRERLALQARRKLMNMLRKKRCYPERSDCADDYAESVLAYMKTAEQRCRPLSLTEIYRKHPNVDPHMRAACIDLICWFCQAHRLLVDEVVFRAIDLFDLFLSRTQITDLHSGKDVSRPSSQTKNQGFVAPAAGPIASQPSRGVYDVEAAALACACISIKLTGSILPMFKILEKNSERKHREWVGDVDRVLEFEVQICVYDLKRDLQVPVVTQFLELYTGMLDVSKREKYLASFLLNLFCVEPDYLEFPPSVKTVAALFLSLYRFRGGECFDDWFRKNLALAADMPYSVIDACVNRMSEAWQNNFEGLSQNLHCQDSESGTMALTNHFGAAYSLNGTYHRQPYSFLQFRFNQHWPYQIPLIPPPQFLPSLDKTRTCVSVPWVLPISYRTVRHGSIDTVEWFEEGFGYTSQERGF